MREEFEKVVSTVENIRVAQEGNIVIVTMNRPKALNALNDQTLNELDQIFTCLENEPEILGVIITGEGKGFVAGADISQMQYYGSEEGRSYGLTFILTVLVPFIGSLVGVALFTIFPNLP